MQLHGLNYTEEEVEQLRKMLGGHPYLTRKALYEIARQERSLSHLLEEGLFRPHLQSYRRKLEIKPDLQQAMKQVIIHNSPVRIDDTCALKLYRLGLVRYIGNDVVPMCELYRLYFRDRFN